MARTRCYSNAPPAVIPAKAGIQKIRRPSASENKHESQPTNPFSLDGRRLG